MSRVRLRRIRINSIWRWPRVAAMLAVLIDHSNHGPLRSVIDSRSSIETPCLRIATFKNTTHLLLPNPHKHRFKRCRQARAQSATRPARGHFARESWRRYRRTASRSDSSTRHWDWHSDQPAIKVVIALPTDSIGIFSWRRQHVPRNHHSASVCASMPRAMKAPGP